MQKWNHSQEQASMKNKTSCWTRLWLDVSKISVNLCWICLYWFCCLNSNRCQKFKQHTWEKNGLSRIFYSNSLRSWLFIWTRGRPPLFPECGPTRVEWAKNTCQSGMKSYMWHQGPVLQTKAITQRWCCTKEECTRPWGRSTNRGSIAKFLQCWRHNMIPQELYGGKWQTFSFET